MIHEFWTFATDVVLALVSWGFAWRLAHRTRVRNSISIKFWILTFVTIGLAAAQGATLHGFKHMLPDAVISFLRVGVIWSLNATAYVLAMALLSFGVPKSAPLYKRVQVLLSVKFVAFLIIAAISPIFIVAIIDYSLSFVVALVVHLRKIRHPASPWILIGVLVSIAAATIQSLKISVSPSFNHNDLYHSVQILGLSLFYVGCLRISDAPRAMGA